MSGRRILIIDDEPDLRRIVADTLTSHGYVVETAADGTEGTRKGALFLPDLVLLDIMMPDMDGFTVYERLRDRPAGLTCPIIFLTARREMDDKLHGFEQGAVDYITKPFHMKELLARVKVHLGELQPLKGDVPNPMTERELEVVEAAGQRQDVQAGRPRAEPLAEHGARPPAQHVRQAERRGPRPAVIVSRENSWI